MKKLISLFLLVPVLWVSPVTLSTVKADTEEVIIDDETVPDAKITYLSLAWDPNLEDNIAGYNVYYGRASGDYIGQFAVGDTTAMIGVRGVRTVYFAVTAFDTNGAESDFSEEVQWP